MPEMISVKSSNIESIGYDELNQYAFVKFLNGSIYRYNGVIAEEFEKFKNAPSIGSHLNKEFKGKYTCEKVEG